MKLYVEQTGHKLFYGIIYRRIRRDADYPETLTLFSSVLPEKIQNCSSSEDTIISFQVLVYSLVVLTKFYEYIPHCETLAISLNKLQNIRNCLSACL
jgi:hypothetical protein